MPFDCFIETRKNSILTCGSGEQIGHGFRMVTRKPRKIEKVFSENVIDITAGGVHSVVLTSNGEVYSCGVNENGIIPVDGFFDSTHDSINTFTKLYFNKRIRDHGKIINIVVGASFTASLTEKGSVLTWGDFRDGGGEMENHKIFDKLRNRVNVLVDFKKEYKIGKIVAGENHLICLSNKGKLFTFGDLSKGQLGRVNGRYPSRGGAFYKDSSGENIKVPNIITKGKDIRFENIFAGGYWSMAIDKNGDVYVCGLNNFDQLGFPTSTEKNSDNRLMHFRKSPIFKKKGHKITHACGMQHIVVRYSNGNIYSIGRNIDNTLGIGSWKGKNDKVNWKSSKLMKIKFSHKIVGITAAYGCSIAWDINGNAWSWGSDTSGQLGLGIKDDDDKMVPKPRKILSKHLIGKKILKVSIADNHSIFLATDV
ncbi:Regulator of chromosome condensation [Strongyloides ratti]|uniref:Regulator of chromosome condensation n=1 Tax=Strongyloides ratti TaxID=34506 RepID=A0A090L584_STRRB|nr:Regulator of chromosome condensation [Strongyloides ratti]CEF62644.1 Regulator of chromosome condensation [Strongyloides ratti]